MEKSYIISEGFKRLSLFYLFFTILVVGELMSKWWDWVLLSYIFKPLLMPTLIYYVYLRFPALNLGRVWLLIWALFFCWVGDLLLLMANTQAFFFILGLFSFLVGHLFYIVNYLISTRGQKNRTLLEKRPLFVLLHVWLASIIYLFLHSYLGRLKIPVLIYALIIVAMGALALNRYGHVGTISFYLVWLGAWSFIFSDSLIALNKFVTGIPQADFWIMLSYIIGQFFIVEGLCMEIALNRDSLREE